MQSGIVERFQSMPIARSAVLWAHVLTSLVANAISLMVVVLVALLMGFRSEAGALAWLAVAGIMMLLTLALTWLAVIPGLTAKSVDGASALPTRSSSCRSSARPFVPTETMPGPVRPFADNQPVTSIVDTIRHLFAQQPVSSDIWVGLAWCLGILVIAHRVATHTYRRKVAQSTASRRMWCFACSASALASSAAARAVSAARAASASTACGRATRRPLRGDGPERAWNRSRHARRRRPTSRSSPPR